ncbi:MAG TPA: GNAT family N-acetyltransferase [Bacteroidales bacterium]|nr:GNAT family N-acetyltransferase [Bacteroidales bacterium]
MDILIKPYSFLLSSEYLLSQICLLDIDVFGVGNNWEANNFLSVLPMKNDLSFIACAGEKVVGYIVCSAYGIKEGLSAHINRIGVHELYKNRKIGNELVRKFELMAKTYKIRSITLEFDKNLNVEKFYEKCGYEHITDKSSISNYLKIKGKLEKRELYYNFNRKIYYKKII